MRLYAARTHRHTHPLTLTGVSVAPSPSNLPERQFSHSHTNNNANSSNTSTNIDSSINNNNTMDDHSLCMTSVGTLDRAMLQLDDDEADEQESGDVDNERILDIDVTGQELELESELLPPQATSTTMTTEDRSGNDHDHDTSGDTLDRAMLQLTTTNDADATHDATDATDDDDDDDASISINNDHNKNQNNSQLSNVLLSSLLNISSDQPLPLSLSDNAISHTNTSDHYITSENIHLHHNNASSCNDHINNNNNSSSSDPTNNSSSGSSSGLFSYESSLAGHVIVIDSTLADSSHVGDTDTTTDLDPRRCVTNPVAKTLLRLSGKLDTGDIMGDFAGVAAASSFDDCHELNSSGLRDVNVNDGDDIQIGGGMDAEEDEGIRRDRGEEEEDDVVRFRCSVDAADDRGEEVGDADTDGLNDNDVEEEEDEDEDDSVRRGSPVATSAPSVNSSSPSSFLFQPINAASATAASVDR